ncbi:MAG: pantetheine-phosphate adenylyltransferase [Kiritimatiellae bacterium]|jgi:pantetheine-phosphate adenylyltransferase|nr:pantetheine-phosphate adenylyltransferase [Kiritimatiellia bacterium]
MNDTVIYAGTFDPLTLGHYDLIERSAEIFDNVILAVARSTPKNCMFSLEERVDMARLATLELDNVEVDVLDGMLVDYAAKRNVRLLIRGLRAYSDFEYEFQMALTNRKLKPEIETMFMMPKEVHSYVSSSIVREIAKAGGDTNDFVPEEVQKMILKKVKEL